jgi:putative ABC transport system permease protein
LVDNIPTALPFSRALVVARITDGVLDNNDEMIATLKQDLVCSVRMFVKRPLFSAIVLITLALGIGANTTIFSVVNAVLLRPLAYPRAERLVMLWQDFQKEGWSYVPFSVPDYLEFKSSSTSYEQIAAAFLEKEDFSLTGEGDPEQVYGMPVSTNLFSTLGVQPALGRGFLPEEDQQGNERVVILSNRLFQRKFAGDPSIVGRYITLGGLPFMVVGVMGPGFSFPPPVASGPLTVRADRELWIPYVTGSLNRNNHPLALIARLKSGTTLSQARVEAETFGTRLELEYPNSNTGIGANVMPMQEMVVKSARPALWLLLGASGVVLLIGCANIANLLMVRASGRRREMGVRAALGASRGRLIRQMLTESVTLSLAGGCGGLLIAEWGMDLLRSQGAATVPRIDEAGIDFTVALFALAVSLLTGLLFGLIPAFQASQTRISEWLKEGGRISAGTASRRMRSVLVIAEVTLAVVLVIGAGLLIRSFVRLMEINPGFKPDHLLTAGIRLPSSRYKDDAQISAFTTDIIAKVQELPGVVSAATVNSLPIDGFSATTEFFIEGRPHPASISESNFGGQRVISPDYFATMGIPLIQGRGITDDDRLGSAKVVVISEALAHRYFGDEDPLQKRIKIDSKGSAWSTIVGVVGDVRHGGLAKEPGPEFYLPQAQENWNVMALVVRSSGDPSALAQSIREQVWAVDKEQPVFNVRTMEAILSQSVATSRFSLMLLNGFAALALLLSALGIYGVISYSVAQRTQEIGIRLALGARRSDVVRLVLSQGAPLVVGGIALGIGVALLATRLMEGLLFATSATDFGTFSSVSLLLGVVGLLACYAPARRAAAVDAMVALRYE